MDSLGEVITRLRSVTPDAVVVWVGEAIVTALPLAVAGCLAHFTTSTGPDGKPWKPLKFDRPGQTGAGPLVDSGKLRDSIVGVAEGGSVTLMTDRIGAAVHQYGDTIVPVNAHYLCIPTTVRAKQAGSPRNYPGELRPVVNKERTRGVLLAEGSDPDGRPSKEGDGWHVAFVMTTGPVVIPPRPFLGFADQTVDEMADVVIDHVVDRWLFSDSRT